MRKFAILAAAAAAVVATPVLAQSTGEGRVEARGGVAWAGGAEEAFAGVAAGYDFDIGEQAFVGVEASADKVLASGANVLWGIGGRAGAKVGPQGKLYVNGGYGFTEGADAAYIGAGYQHKFGTNVYGKLEYRRTLNSGTDVNFAGAGLGFAF